MNTGIAIGLMFVVVSAIVLVREVISAARRSQGASQPETHPPKSAHSGRESRPALPAIIS